MLASSLPDQIAAEASDVAEPGQGVTQGVTWGQRLVAVAYGSTVSVAMLGWLYALAHALSSGVSWMLS